MATEAMRGTFSDYTAPQRDIYNPWAVGINAFMGGTQYAADRKAVQQERQFSEETRNRSRDQWGRDDKLREGAAKIAQKYRELLDAQDEVSGADTGEVVQPGVTMQAAGMKPQTIAGPKTAVTAVAQARLRRDNPITSTRLAAMQAAEMADNAMDAGFHEQADQYRAKQQELYGQYVKSAANSFNAALESRDPRSMDRVREQYRDIWDAFGLNVVRTDAPVLDKLSGAQVSGFQLTEADGSPAKTDDGKVIPPMNRVELAQYIGGLVGDPAVQQSLLANAFAMHESERKTWQATEGLNIEKAKLQQQEITLREAGNKAAADWVAGIRTQYTEGMSKAEGIDFIKTLGAERTGDGDVVGGRATFRVVTKGGEVPITDVSTLDYGQINQRARDIFASSYARGTPVTSDMAARASVLVEVARASGQEFARDGLNEYRWGVTNVNGRPVEAVLVTSLARNKDGRPRTQSILPANPSAYMDAVLAGTAGQSPAVTGFEVQAMAPPAAQPAPRPGRPIVTAINPPNMTGVIRDKDGNVVPPR